MGATLAARECLWCEKPVAMSDAGPYLAELRGFCHRGACSEALENRAQRFRLELRLERRKLLCPRPLPRRADGQGRLELE